MLASFKKRLFKYFIRVLLILPATLVFFSFFPAAGVDAQTTTVRIDNRYNVKVGTFEEISVYVTNIAGMGAFSFYLRYDPQVVLVKPAVGQSIAVKLGDALTGANPIINLNNADQGLIRVGWYDLNEFSGTGEICRISFEIIAAGETELRLENMEVAGQGGKIGVGAINGLITAAPPPPVTGISIPTGNRSLNIGSAVQLTSIIKPDDMPGKGRVWTSDNPSVATVSSTGLVTARAAGTAKITVTVDHEGSNYSDTITVTVSGPSELTIASPRELAYGYTGNYYSYQLTAEGGTTPYRWTRISGNLPPGLNLSTAGEIYGTPYSPGRYGFTLRVEDWANRYSDQEFFLWVGERDYYYYYGGSYSSGFSYTYEQGTFANMTINHGSMEINLQPHQLPYTMVVDRNTGHINIRAALAGSGDRLTVNGTTQPANTYRKITLKSGSNYIDLSVRSSGGAVKNYGITIYKIP